ncbi:hypothetical protein HZA97_01935 [Candidatus Woesearchaeota archaeon]|nr:hypothetical protein [Candidatus Woesearchaeota archaeon]
MQTVVDQGVEVNTEVSAKAHKLANYVFERPIKNSFHIVDGGVVGTFAVVNIDEKEYFLNVFDHQNTNNAKDTLELRSETLKNDGSLESEVIIRDTGLDGNADYAFARSRSENKEFFQAEYINLLDKLITFYEENTSEDDEWSSQYSAARAKKLKNFLATSEKGERDIEKNENYTSGKVKFVHNNKGYEIYFFSCNENHTAERTDLLSITVYSLENGVGRYLNLRDYAALGRVLLGESIFYKTKGKEELLPDFATINESDYIQETNYDSAFEETRKEKDFLQVEYDKVLDELIEFYESK